MQIIGADYIIVENSICYSSSAPGCRIIDLIDMHNGHQYSEETDDDEDLEINDTPKFCHALFAGISEYTQYFRLVFSNKTFRVYRVM